MDETKDKFEPTVAERLIIAMLCDIYKRLDIEDSFDVSLLEEAAVGPHHWALKWKYHLDAPPVPDAVADEVANILEMWEFIELSYEALSAEDRDTVQNYHEFRGFDSHEDSSYYGVADVMIHRLKSFERFAERDLNSHYPSLHRHLAMLDLFTPIKKGWLDRSDYRMRLTREQINELFGGE